MAVDEIRTSATRVVREVGTLQRDSVALYAVLEQLPLGIVLADIPSGLIVFHNRRAEEILGEAVTELGSVADLELLGGLHADGTPFDCDDYSLAKTVRGHVAIEDRDILIRRRDGTTLQLSVSSAAIAGPSGEPIYAICSFHDVSAQRRSADELRATSVSMRLATEAAKLGRWDHDLASGTRFWDERNKALFATAGDADRAASESEYFLSLIHPEDRGRVQQAITDAMQPHHSHNFYQEYRIGEGATPTTWVASYGTTLFEDDRCIRFVGVTQDITEDKRLEERLQRSNDELEAQVRDRTLALQSANDRLVAEMAERARVESSLRQMHKMEAVGQLTGGIAHDFNNMLTGIIGSLELIKRRVANGRADEIGRFIDAAMVSANRAAALTHRLLAFSRRQSLEAKPVDVGRLVISMQDLFVRTIGPSISLDIRVSDTAWLARTDENQLENALLNLVINARDAMPDGGLLTVETTNARLDRHSADAFGDLQPGDYLLLSVSDTGAGMPPDVIAKAFEPFFTTKPIGQGTGLGLSMIYGFMKQSGGHVLIYSEVAHGTSVKLYLPRDRSDPKHQAPEPSEAVTGHANGDCVLVVEDEPAVRMLILDVLADLGYRTFEAGDAPSALPIVSSDERIDLLVTDVGLPGVNGRQLAEMARQIRPDLKVLFITGYAEIAAVRGGFLAPGMEMLSKPFAVNVLSAKIRSMIEGSTR
ncbi:ATP-binding protein [Lichenihabitans psoromatis]|uniref:ATP-binding protein n=1 Tax=Lichenihabitans psoromatis TaxID=2528642 RepID=UPI001038335E|nr:ATP-binding protein [Lichenihabitans psoromatis]